MISIALISGYFDFNDYSSPVKTYLLDTNYFTLVPDVTQYVTYPVQKNTVILNDDIYFGSQGTQIQQTYYEIVDIQMG